ncbi:MAG: NUDIX domain-containing protein [Candidatus Thorarchaeota archaeon]
MFPIKDGIAHPTHIRIKLASPDGSRLEEPIYGRCLLNHLTILHGQSEQDLHFQTLCNRVQMHRESIDLIILTPSTPPDPQSLFIAHAETCPTFFHPTEERTSQRIRVATAAVIERDDGAMLLTRRTTAMKSFPKTWVVPGGHIELHETWKEALQREIQEEVGLKDLYDLKILGLWESVYPPVWQESPPLRQHLVIYWTCKTSSQAIQPSKEEIEEYVWLTPAQAASLVGRNAISGQIEVVRVEDSSSHLLSLSDMRGSLKTRTGTTQGTRFALTQHSLQ